MIIRNDFMKNNDGKTPLVPGTRSPFDYIADQKKIRELEQAHQRSEKAFASADELKKLDNQNNMNHISNIGKFNK